MMIFNYALDYLIHFFNKRVYYSYIYYSSVHDLCKEVIVTVCGHLVFSCATMKSC